MSSDRSLPRPGGLGVPFLGGTHQDKYRAIREFRPREHGLEYGQDLRLRHFYNDFNATARMLYPQRVCFACCG